MRPLPIDPLLPELVQKLAAAPSAVLEAEPGAGKTTRVPGALLAAFGAKGRVVVTEPRRLAARLAAGFVATERGESLGRTVGYSVRFEHRASDDTKLLYVTEGVLLRRLLDDPVLSDVAVVVLDEFHERHLTTDVLLALLLRLLRGPRPDLRLVVMSATLDGEALAAHLGAERLKSEGRVFPLTIEHSERPDDRPLERQVRSAVVRLLEAEPDGDILVFLPGAREIRLATAALAPDVADGRAVVLPLHGDLPIADQARAVERGRTRKVILSTNVAESSVTIEGVTAVVDSGLARVAGHSPWSGLPTLSTAKISRASAKQRAGRAARVRPGKVIRLYTAGDFTSRPEQDKPEILREDLAETFLVLHGVGARPAELPWLDAPPPASLDAGERLLRTLDALDGDGALTKIGRRMLSLPLPPRLARLVVEGEARGVAREASLAAALLSERDIRTDARADVGGGRGSRQGSRTQASGPSDVLELMDRFREADEVDFDPRRLGFAGIDANAAKAVERAARQIASHAEDRGERPKDVAGVDRALQIALYTAFSDRLARRKNRNDRTLVLTTGKTAKLAETSVVDGEMLVVALDADDVPGRGAVVRLASGVEPSFVFDLRPDSVDMTDELGFNEQTEQVERTSRHRPPHPLCFSTRSAREPRRRSTPRAASRRSRIAWHCFASICPKRLCPTSPRRSFSEPSKRSVKASPKYRNFPNAISRARSSVRSSPRSARSSTARRPSGSPCPAVAR
jgi:ATP-dependent helicase HrpB